MYPPKLVRIIASAVKKLVKKRAAKAEAGYPAEGSDEDEDQEFDPDEYDEVY